MNIYRQKPLSQILMALGIQPSFKGFQYLKRGIEFCVKDPLSVSNLSGIIYPQIAEEFNTTASAVERAARNAITTGWHRRDKALAKDIFGNTLQSAADVPTNSLYIAALAEWLRDDND